MASQSLMLTLVQMPIVAPEYTRIRLCHINPSRLVDQEYTRASRINSLVYLALINANFDNDILYVEGEQVAKGAAIHDFVRDAFPLTYIKAIHEALLWADADHEPEDRHPSPFEQTLIDGIREEGKRIGVVDE